MSRDRQIWLVTGASSGIGRAITEQAAATGHTVIAVARRRHLIEELSRSAPGRIIPLTLDVADVSAVERATVEIVQRFERVDVLVNNAGRGYLAAAEATDDSTLRELFDLHMFGPAAFIRGLLPTMRRQRSGAIVQISSLGGRMAFPGSSGYCASKFALEGFSEALAAEVAPFGIKVTIVEPGAFQTEASTIAVNSAQELNTYAETVGVIQAETLRTAGAEPGDPRKAARAVVTALRSAQPPLRLPLGPDAVVGTRYYLDRCQSELDQWKHLGVGTDF